MSLLGRHRSERGAVAIIVALMMVVLLGSAALGLDIAKLAYERQQLQNSLDSAAAAGAQQLPGNAAKAIEDAEKFASDNMVAAGLGAITPSVALRCVVAYNNITNSPDWATVSSLCGITSKVWDPLTCNDYICSVPCTAGQQCNTIVVKHNKEVDYSFGPAIGINKGDTGTMVSAACRGFCGKAIPNPMDVVVMADRTPSMSSSALTALKEGLVNMFSVMNSQQQFVALGTIAIGWARDGCLNETPKGGEAFTAADYRVSGTPWSATNKLWKFAGKWVSVPYSSDYSTLTTDGIEVNTSSALYKASTTCLNHSSDEVRYPAPTAGWDGNQYAGQPANTNEGTHLASALKGAVNYVLDAGNLAGMPARDDLGTPKKVVIFETDGAPSEIFSSADSATSLSSPYDIGVAGAGGSAKACSNLAAIATEAKSKGVMIIVIGYGNVNTARCKTNDSSTALVRDVLAGVASKGEDGAASTATDCTSETARKAENSDRDNYFCGASADDLKGIFLTAMGQISGHGRLMALPGI